MLGRKLVVAASFVLLISGAVSAQTASSDAARTESLVKQALERYTAGLEASRVQNPLNATNARPCRSRSRTRSGGRSTTTSKWLSSG